MGALEKSQGQLYHAEAQNEVLMIGKVRLCAKHFIIIVHLLILVQCVHGVLYSLPQVQKNDGAVKLYYIY